MQRPNSARDTENLVKIMKCSNSCDNEWDCCVYGAPQCLPSLLTNIRQVGSYIRRPSELHLSADIDTHNRLHDMPEIAQENVQWLLHCWITSSAFSEVSKLNKIKTNIHCCMFKVVVSRCARKSMTIYFLQLPEVQKFVSARATLSLNWHCVRLSKQATQSCQTVMVPNGNQSKNQ